MLGKSFDDAQVAQFLSSLDKNHEQHKECKSFPDKSSYLSYKPLGLQFLILKNQIIDAIFLYNKSNVFKPYAQVVPHQILLSMSNVDVVKKFGEPSKKGGGGRTGNIWISYEKLGIQFDFQGSDWNDLKNPIQMITLFPTATTGK